MTKKRTPAEEAVEEEGDDAIVRADSDLTLTHRSETSVDQHDQLAGLADRIDRHHQEAIGSAHQALTHARDAGIALTEAKQVVPHGEWAAWVKANCGFSLRTAQKYMEVAAKWDSLVAKAPSTALLGIEAAIKQLAKPAPQKQTDGASPPDDQPDQQERGTSEPQSSEPSIAVAVEQKVETFDDMGHDDNAFGDEDIRESRSNNLDTGLAKANNPVAYILGFMAGGQCHPHPSQWNIPPDRAVSAWVYESPLLHEQNIRNSLLAEGASDRVAEGLRVIGTCFCALGWAGLIEHVGEGQFRLTKGWAGSEATQIGNPVDKSRPNLADEPSTDEECVWEA